MASGKSSVGKLLAEKYNYEFIDTDEMIEKLADKPISQIFQEDGEEKFRNYESGVAKDLNDLEGKIIATGGGIIKRSENRKLLKKAGKVVYLEVTPEEVVERIEDYTTRPLLNFSDKETRITKAKEILDSRLDIYESVADIKIKTITGNPQKAADQIFKLLGS